MRLDRTSVVLMVGALLVAGALTASLGLLVGVGLVALALFAQ